MGIFQVALVVATLLCSLVAGFLVAFAVVAMPGIGTLGDAGFLRAFRAMDRVIQDNQPLFMLIWVGSVVALVAATVLGFGRLEAGGRWLLVSAAVLYLLGVQLPTATINIPLNNTVQALELDRMDGAELEAARRAFEPRWNRWNSFRTLLATTASALLMVLLLRL